MLYFKPNGDPVFGKDVFKFPRKNPRRLMFEYSTDISMSVKYNERRNQIVYSHLSSRQQGSLLDGQFQYYRNDEESQEFVDDFAHPGLIDFDINNVNMDRLTKYLEGSIETGNAQTDAEGEALGNVVPSDLGEKMLKSKKRRAEKIADQKASMTNLRGITPDVQKVKQVKEDVNIDVESMKKLWNYNKKTQ